MRHRFVTPLGALITSILAAALTAVAGPAAAADPQVTVVGGAAIPTSAPSTDQITYVISVGNGPIDGVVMHAHQPAAAPADPASVVVDGAPAPAGTVQQSGVGLVIDLGTGASAGHGGTLATGNHTVAFDQDVATMPTGADSAYAVVDYVVAGQVRHARSAPIPLALPDLRLTKPSGSGENRTLPLGTGLDGDFEAILSNSGGDTNASTLTITLPVGLQVDRSFGVYRDDNYRSPTDTGGTRLKCASPTPNVVRCVLGAVASGTSSLLDIPVQPVKSAPVGQVGTFAVNALADSGLDANPADNTVHGSVRFTGTAHLVVKLTPRTARIVVGRRGTVIASVHNVGPDPAARAFGLIALRGTHFTIVGFTGRQLGPVTTSAALARAHWGARSAAGPRAAATPRGVPLVLWNVGTIGPGRTTQATVTLKARTAGRDEMLLGAGSSAGDPPCQRQVPTPRCKAFGFATLIALRPAPHTPASLPSTSLRPTATTARPAASSTAPVLAQTGPRAVRAQVTTGVLAVLAGALLVAAGSLRPTRRH